MMLTGNQDLVTATNAVNDGQVFRFLSKPCPGQLLADTVEDGIRQYDLITSQHELFHKTFCGSVKVLTEVLELSHPDLFSRSHAVVQLLEELMGKLGVEERWEYKLAARLAHVGCIVAPSESDNGTTKHETETGVIGRTC